MVMESNSEVQEEMQKQIEDLMSKIGSGVAQPQQPSGNSQPSNSAVNGLSEDIKRVESELKKVSSSNQELMTRLQ